jgi:hypothetical protein
MVMQCVHAEERLSEYLDRSLPEAEMGEVAGHLKTCSNCSALSEQMRSALAACTNFPKLEPDLALIERILLRTSGRSRSLSVREWLSRFFVRPLLTPRFALGTVITMLFFVLLGNFMLPRLSAVAAALSPEEIFHRMDRGVQQVYGEGLKVYDKKSEWQAQFNFFRENFINRLGFMIDQLDAPVEESKKPQPQKQQNERVPTEKSGIMLRAA